MENIKIFSEVVVIGLNHKTASVKTRECFAVKDEEFPDLYKRFKSEGIDEVVYLSTCNRAEVYFACNPESLKSDVKKVISIMEDVSQISLNENQDVLYTYFGEDAVTHLYEVISSLDSMVIGENEIVGQIKDAFTHAVHNKSVASILNKLFHMAFRTAKQVRSETDITKNPLSVAYIAAELVRKIFPDLSKRNALLIGAGEMGELILKYLSKNEIGKITIANRSIQNATKVAEEMNVNVDVIPLGEMEKAADEVDIIISSVTAPHYLITQEMINDVVRDRDGQPLFMIDIAVPRNIDPEVGRHKSIHLYNIDDLQSIANENLKTRLSEVELAKELIETNVKEFFGWYSELEVAPTIKNLQEKFEEIRLMELDRYKRRKLKHLSEEEFLAVEELTKQIMSKTLHNPIINLKKHQQSSKGDEPLTERLKRKTRFLEELFVK